METANTGVGMVEVYDLLGEPGSEGFTRLGWNNPEKFIFFVPGSTFIVNRPPLLGIFPEGTPITYRSHIDMCYPDGTIGPWLPLPADAIANDYVPVSF